MYLVFDGTNRPYRCKTKAPGFSHQAVNFYGEFSYVICLSLCLLISSLIPNQIPGAN